MDKFMPDVSEQERIQVLQDTADKVRQESYDAPLSDDEIENRKSDFFKNALEIEDLEDAKKEAATEFSDQIKEVKVKNREIRNEIKSGAAKKEGILYDIANYESGYMETFDKSGDLIEKRRLTPVEKKGQSRLFIPDNLKTGTK